MRIIGEVRMTEKIYVGGAKAKEWEDGNTSFNISFSDADIKLLIENQNEKGYVNLKMNKRREPSQYGQTHSIVIDDWKPTPSAQPAPQPTQQVTQVSNEQVGADDDDIPF